MTTMVVTGSASGLCAAVKARFEKDGHAVIDGLRDALVAAVAVLMGSEAVWIHGSVLFVDGVTDAMLASDRL